ncbi:hypothetical protein Taro_011270 [Colocasia esculenta]|uniref:Uncharacterized protein n=1 Tax=Colocasia esculenta TaxID=4460 RepID=A0A843U5E0_COLES|nr:hypothetical protein [Colocasia esculenta]
MATATPGDTSAVDRHSCPEAMARRGRRSAQSRKYEQSRKVKKFVKGLKPSLKARLLEFDPCSLEEVLGVANRQESRVEPY